MGGCLPYSGQGQTEFFMEICNHHKKHRRKDV